MSLCLEIPLILFTLSSGVYSQDFTGCFFLAEPRKDVVIPLGLSSFKVANYFRIFYHDADPFFVDEDQNGIPDAIQKQVSVLERSRHFLQTELGWKVPATRRDLADAELHVYFISGPPGFEGTTRGAQSPLILFDRSILQSKYFAALWIHQLAHASELTYRASGDPWFFEATAGWMEAQFDAYSKTTQLAQSMRFAHPDRSITDATPQIALGTSTFLEIVSRPYRDVVRQIWDVWSYSREEPLMEIISKVLAVNHLPDLSSRLKSYFALFPATELLGNGTVVLQPYSALIRRALPAQSHGGAQISFLPSGYSFFSAGLIVFEKEKSIATSAFQTSLAAEWSILAPFAGLDHYQVVIVNCSASELRGSVQTVIDDTIPAVLEYFQATSMDDNIQIEWKTQKESGVSFWNLYRVQQGKKTLVNAIPIPARIHSHEALHYLYIDAPGATSYVLEAVTEQGLPGALATVENFR
ncbi:MAG TPA: hypothetical protein VI958_10755 [Acidobacteriota bacterium]